MIHNVFDFRSVRVRDVMVPLAKVVAVQPDTPVADALQLSDAAGIERLPVITREGKSARTGQRARYFVGRESAAIVGRPDATDRDRE